MLRLTAEYGEMKTSATILGGNCAASDEQLMAAETSSRASRCATLCFFGSCHVDSSRFEFWQGIELVLGCQPMICPWNISEEGVRLIIRTKAHMMAQASSR